MFNRTLIKHRLNTKLEQYQLEVCISRQTRHLAPLNVKIAHTGRFIDGKSSTKERRCYLSGRDFLLLGDFNVQPVVLELEGTHAVDVNGQAVVKRAQLLFLLQARDPRGAQQRLRGRRAARRTARGCGRHIASRYRHPLQLK